MKVKNIKSFIDFYQFLDISTSVTDKQRNSESRPIVKNKDYRKEKIISEKSNDNPLDKNNALSNLKSKAQKLDCDLKDIATNLVFSDGNPSSDIMLIGEAPGADEDKIGKPFVGQAGILLDKMFSLIDLDRKKNFYITNILFWRPPGNRTPSSREISTCLNITKEHINIIKPKLLILLGGISSKSLLNTADGITKLRCKKHLYENGSNNSKILTKTVFHPAYLLRNPIEKKRMWEDLQDIDKIIKENKIRR
jgi:DNA polymerase